MNPLRSAAALMLILSLAGQLLVRPLHHHDSPQVSETDRPAEICRFCHRAHATTPAQQPGPSSPSHDDEDCTICRYLSLATLPTLDVELPPAGQVAEQVLVEPVSASVLFPRLFDVRGPPLT